MEGHTLEAQNHSETKQGCTCIGYSQARVFGSGRSAGYPCVTSIRSCSCSQCTTAFCCPLCCHLDPAPAHHTACAAQAHPIHGQRQVPCLTAMHPSAPHAHVMPARVRTAQVVARASVTSQRAMLCTHRYRVRAAVHTHICTAHHHGSAPMGGM